MDRHIPKPGEKYRHFKGKQYQILCVARHSETKEPLVVYQALYGDFSCFARPLEIFMEEADHRKYPQTQQRYRFELLTDDNVQEIWDETEEDDEEARGKIKAEDKRSWEGTESGAGIWNEAESRTLTEETDEELDGEEHADPALLQFLDADTLEQKYQVLKMLEGSITNRLIDDFAVALDLVIPEDSLDNRYFQLLSSVRTMQRFENNRFR